MSKISLVLILMLFAGRLPAQQDYFIFFQADNNQPFYILRGDKSYSSSAQGHLILAQLKEGVVTFKVGWPGKRWPEQMFLVSVKSDMEFQIKNLGEKGWQLFNPQTLELKAPEKADATADAGLSKEGVKKDDAFSRMMAGVVSDTAVMYNTYAMDKVLKDVPAATAGAVPVVAKGSVGNGSTGGAAEVMVDTAVGIGKGGTEIKEGVINSVATNNRDTAMAKVDSGLNEGGLPAAERLQATKKLVKVQKISEKKGTKQWRGVYTDGVGKRADTIVVIIPNDTVVRAAKGVDTVKKVQAMTFNELVKADTAHAGKRGAQPVEGVETRVVGVVPEKTGGNVEKGNATGERAAVEVTEKKVVIMDKESVSGGKESVSGGKENVSGGKENMGVGKENVTGGKESVNGGKAAKVTVVNSDCKNFATDYDLDKLRVKMLEASKDDDRIVYAKKIFKTKCFTTRQIRALSEVFVSDGQKYRFFETAYPFVSDDRFGELASLLADPVYNSKFKAMTGQ